MCPGIDPSTKDTSMPRNRSVDRAFAEAPAAAFTLHDLVDALCETGADDGQVVAAVVDLLRTHRVRLVGPVDEARVLHRCTVLNAAECRSRQSRPERTRRL